MVAVALEAQLKVLSSASPVALALAAALMAFGLSVAHTTIGSTVEVIIDIDTAGKHTKNALADVMDTYRGIFSGVSAMLSNGRASTGWVSTVSASTTSNISEMVSGLLGASAMRSVDEAAYAVADGWRGGASTRSTGRMFRGSLSPPSTTDASSSELSTVEELVELERQATRFCRQSSQTTTPSPQETRRPTALALGLLSALTMPVVPSNGAQLQRRSGQSRCQ